MLSLWVFLVFSLTILGSITGTGQIDLKCNEDEGAGVTSPSKLQQIIILVVM